MSGDAAPLPLLLGRVLVAFTRDAEAADVRPPFRLPLWANMLRVLHVPGGVPRGKVRPRSGLSQRRITPTLNALTRWGWVTVEGEARRKVVRLTDTGQAVAGAWRPVPGGTEARWRADIGDGRVEQLRAALAALVGRLPIELPHYPATYGQVDRTIAGQLGTQILGRDVLRPGVDHGSDWRPVPRPADGGDAAELPLYALASQVFVAVALDFEAGRYSSFEVATIVLRHVPDDGTPLTAPRFPDGLPANTDYALRRHRLATIERDEATGAEVIRLTDRGRACRDAWAREVARITEAWRAAYGPEVVDEVVAAVSDLVAHLPTDVPDYPVRT